MLALKADIRIVQVTEPLAVERYKKLLVIFGAKIVDIIPVKTFESFTPTPARVNE